MIDRPDAVRRVTRALQRSPVAAILGPRQVGKTTLAGLVGRDSPATTFDLESPADLARLANPEMALSAAEGLVVIDEIQRRPDLFEVIRVLVDREDRPGRFLVLGSASPGVTHGASESLAGRVEFVDLTGLRLDEVGADHARDLWVRGGFPRSFLAASDEDSFAWREAFLRTFLERDVPQLGFRVPAPTMRRFWTMVAHYHGQTWNASVLARSMGLTDKTIRGYLDILDGTYVVRTLPPWSTNVAKRQVKSPKVYLRDSGLLHALLSLPDHHAITGHPQAGASWEGFALEQTLQFLPASVTPYFWATHQGAELDLTFAWRARGYGVEFKYTETPRVTRSMRIAMEDLELDRLWVVHAGGESFPLDDRIDALAWTDLPRLAEL